MIITTDGIVVLGRDDLPKPFNTEGKDLEGVASAILTNFPNRNITGIDVRKEYHACFTYNRLRFQFMIALMKKISEGVPA